MSYNISIELSNDENLRLKEAVGERRKVLAAAVAEVYITKQPNHNKWVRKGVGTLCLIKDFGVKSYYFKLFSVKEANLLWMEELYVGLNYVCDSSFFHSFEAEDCIVGFNFANDARNFRNAVQLLLQRGSKDNKNDSTKSHKKASAVNGKTKKEKKQLARIKLNGIEISAPQNFKHVAHVPSKTNEEPYNYNPELVDMFRKIGITEKILEDRNTKAKLEKVINEESFKIEAIARKTPTNQYKRETLWQQERAPSLPPTNSLLVTPIRSKKLAPLPPPSPTINFKSMTELDEQSPPSPRRIKKNAPLIPSYSSSETYSPPTTLAPIVQIPNLPALPPRKKVPNLTREPIQAPMPSTTETVANIPPPPPLPDLNETFNKGFTIRPRSHDEPSPNKHEENKRGDFHSDLGEVLRSVIEERFVAIQGDDDESSNSEWDD